MSISLVLNLPFPDYVMGVHLFIGFSEQTYFFSSSVNYLLMSFVHFFCCLLFLKKLSYLFIYLEDCTGVQLLHTSFSLVMASRGYSLVAVHGFLIILGSLVQHRLQGTGAPVPRLQSTVSIVVAKLLGSMWDPPGLGMEIVSPLLQADSLPLSHQGIPCLSS